MDGYRVKNSWPVKLKDKPGRHMYPFNLKQTFGFVPEVVIVQKIKGENNRIILSAIMTEDELKKEKLQIKEKNEHKPNPTKGHTKKDDVS